VVVVVTGHRLYTSFPSPSGWKMVCTCGHVARGVNQAHAFERLVEHEEQAGERVS
jgi:hypothetical protein